MKCRGLSIWRECKKGGAPCQQKDERPVRASAQGSSSSRITATTSSRFWAWTFPYPGHDLPDGREDLLRVEPMVRILPAVLVADEAGPIDDDIGALCQAERGGVRIIDH